ncbi:MAG: hypothetical protein M1814_002525 [Vezdaea aestivalis]|nr:MAG: hypothetical protein M1814_002525 [Vezdaea aestivalis]
MGAGQSAADGGSAGDEPKRCYYDLLQVDIGAPDEEIRKAYKKRALELHPDRNYGDVDNATKLFTQIQAAYEVLSDPQEKAWYDSNREAILRGFDKSDPGISKANISVTTAQDVLELLTKNNGRARFADDSAGAFDMFINFFAKLADEEVEACSYLGEETPDLPGFGKANADWDETVRPFYHNWSRFLTSKTYSWKDTYRLSDAPNRVSRREMEKRNKRNREQAVAEFNDAVRTLVAFVKKRDPRVKRQTLSDETLAQQQRQAAKTQSARSRASNQAKLDCQIVPDWCQSSNTDNGKEGSVVGLEDEESEDIVFECLVCNKVFKSENQVRGHEKSRKHVRLEADIRRAIWKEEVLNQEAKVSGLTESTEHDSKLQAECSRNEAEDAPDRELNPAILGGSSSPSLTTSNSQMRGMENLAVKETTSQSDATSEISPRDRISQLAETDTEKSKEVKGKLKVGKAKEKRARKAARHATEAQKTEQIEHAQVALGDKETTEFTIHTNRTVQQSIERKLYGEWIQPCTFRQMCRTVIKKAKSKEA